MKVMTLPGLQAAGRERSISPVGFTPNEWEPVGSPSEKWDKTHLEEVELCRAFIQAADLSRPWQIRSSYGLKHDVERANLGASIANGSFILAASLEGLSMQPDGVNATVRWPRRAAR